MDLVDRAREEEEVHRAESLRRLQTAGAVAYPAAPADHLCIDCGGEIGAERRRAVPRTRRCVWCQDAAEQARRMAR